MTETFSVIPPKSPKDNHLKPLLSEIRYYISRIKRQSKRHPSSPLPKNLNSSDLDLHLEPEPCTIEVSEVELRNLGYEDLVNYRNLLADEFERIEGCNQSIGVISATQSMWSPRGVDESLFIRAMSPLSRSMILELENADVEEMGTYQKKLEEEIEKLNEEVVELKDFEKKLLTEYLKTYKEKELENPKPKESKKENKETQKDDSERIQKEQEIERLQMYCEDLCMRLYIAEEKLAAKNNATLLINATMAVNEEREDKELSGVSSIKKEILKQLGGYERVLGSPKTTRKNNPIIKAGDLDPLVLNFEKKAPNAYWSYVNQLQEQIIEMNTKHSEAISELKNEISAKDEKIKNLLSTQENLKRKVEKVVSFERWRDFTDKVKTLKDQSAEINAKEKKLQELALLLKNQQNKISQRIDKLKITHEDGSKIGGENHSFERLLDQEEETGFETKRVTSRANSKTRELSNEAGFNTRRHALKNIERLMSVERLWKERVNQGEKPPKASNPLTDSSNIPTSNLGRSEGRARSPYTRGQMGVENQQTYQQVRPKSPFLKIQTTAENEKTQQQIEFFKQKCSVYEEELNKMREYIQKFKKSETRLNEMDKLLKVEAKKLSMQKKLLKLEWEKIENKKKELEFMEELLQVYSVNVTK